MDYTYSPIHHRMHPSFQNQNQLSVHLPPMPTSSTYSARTPFLQQQVNFWHSLDEALKRVETQLASPGVRLTLRVLKQTRRIIAVAALTEGGNTGVDHANKVGW